MSPEMVLKYSGNDLNNIGIFDPEKCDVFSFGLTILRFIM